MLYVQLNSLHCYRMLVIYQPMSSSSLSSVCLAIHRNPSPLSSRFRNKAQSPISIQTASMSTLTNPQTHTPTHLFDPPTHPPTIRAFIHSSIHVSMHAVISPYMNFPFINPSVHSSSPYTYIQSLHLQVVPNEICH